MADHNRHGLSPVLLMNCAISGTVLLIEFEIPVMYRAMDGRCGGLYFCFSAVTDALNNNTHMTLFPREFASSKKNRIGRQFTLFM